MTFSLDDLSGMITPKAEQYMRQLEVVQPTGDSYDPETGYSPGADEVYTCRGIWEYFSEYYIAEGTATRGEVKVFILQETIDVEPDEGDLIKIDGEQKKITNVDTDPADVLFVCRAGGE